MVALTPEEVRRMGKIPEQLVHVAPEVQHKYGDRTIMASSEVGHQIHCLVSCVTLHYTRHLLINVLLGHGSQIHIL